MLHTSTPIQIDITSYLSEKKTDILDEIDKHRRVLIHANPASGKTTLFKELSKDIQNGTRNGRLIFENERP